MQSLNTGDALTIKLGGAAATSNPYFFGSYIGSASSAITADAAIAPTQLSGATPVTLLSSPPSGTVWHLTSFTMTNTDTAKITVSILLNGTVGPMFEMDPGDVLQFGKNTDEWTVKAKNGATKQTLSLNWGQLGGSLSAQTDLQAALDAKADAATTVNGHALSSNVTVSASDVGLGNVTNDAQTKAAVVPNTAPAAGQIFVGVAGGGAYAPKSLSGAITVDANGVTTAALATSTTAGVSSGTSMAALLAAVGVISVRLADHTCGVGETAFDLVCVGAQYERLEIEMDFPGGLAGVTQNPVLVADGVNAGRFTAIYTTTHSAVNAIQVAYAALGMWTTTWSLSAKLWRSTVVGREWSYTSDSHNISPSVAGDITKISGSLPQWNTKLTFKLDGGAAFPTGTTIIVRGDLKP